MISSWVVAVMLAGAPGKAAVKEVPLTTIDAPFGHFGDVVVPEKGATPTTDLPVRFAPESCEPQIIRLAAQVTGAMAAIEQLTAWVKVNNLEGKLFSRKELLTESIALLTKSSLSANHSCTPLKTRDAFKLMAADAPAKFCAAELERSTGDFWLMADKKPAAVFNVMNGGTNVCRPRISTTLFDSKGKARLLIHLDWGGDTSFTVIGDRCQNLDFTFDTKQQTFTGKRISCK